jgi:hypothetical protein
MKHFLDPHGYAQWVIVMRWHFDPGLLFCVVVNAQASHPFATVGAAGGECPAVKALLGARQRPLPNQQPKTLQLIACLEPALWG